MKNIIKQIGFFCAVWFLFSAQTHAQDTIVFKRHYGTNSSYVDYALVNDILILGNANRGNSAAPFRQMVIVRKPGFVDYYDGSDAGIPGSFYNKCYANRKYVFMNPIGFSNGGSIPGMFNGYYWIRLKDRGPSTYFIHCERDDQGYDSKPDTISFPGTDFLGISVTRFAETGTQFINRLNWNKWTQVLSPSDSSSISILRNNTLLATVRDTLTRFIADTIPAGSANLYRLVRSFSYKDTSVTNKTTNPQYIQSDTLFNYYIAYPKFEDELLKVERVSNTVNKVTWRLLNDLTPGALFGFSYKILRNGSAYKQPTQSGFDFDSTGSENYTLEIYSNSVLIKTIRTSLYFSGVSNTNDAYVSLNWSIAAGLLGTVGDTSVFASVFDSTDNKEIYNFQIYVTGKSAQQVDGSVQHYIGPGSTHKYALNLFVMGSGRCISIGKMGVTCSTTPYQNPILLSTTERYPNKVRLFWVNKSKNITYFNIYRNGQKIGIADSLATSFTDSFYLGNKNNPVNGAFYQYKISGVNVPTGTELAGDSIYLGTTLVNFTATAFSDQKKIVLNWKSVAGKGDKIRIIRNGTVLDDLEISDSSYTDSDPIPGMSYVYQFQILENSYISYEDRDTANIESNGSICGYVISADSMPVGEGGLLAKLSVFLPTDTMVYYARTDTSGFYKFDKVYYQSSANFDLRIIGNQRVAITGDTVFSQSLSLDNNIITNANFSFVPYRSLNVNTFSDRASVLTNLGFSVDSGSFSFRKSIINGGVKYKFTVDRGMADSSPVVVMVFRNRQPMTSFISYMRSNTFELIDSTGIPNVKYRYASVVYRILPGVQQGGIYRNNYNFFVDSIVFPNQGVVSNPKATFISSTDTGGYNLLTWDYSGVGHYGFEILKYTGERTTSFVKAGTNFFVDLSPKNNSNNFYYVYVLKKTGNTITKSPAYAFAYCNSSALPSVSQATAVASFNFYTVSASVPTGPKYNFDGVLCERYDSTTGKWSELYRVSKYATTKQTNGTYSFSFYDYMTSATQRPVYRLTCYRTAGNAVSTPYIIAPSSLAYLTQVASLNVAPGEGYVYISWAPSSQLCKGFRILVRNGSNTSIPVDTIWVRNRKTLNAVYAVRPNTSGNILSISAESYGESNGKIYFSNTPPPAATCQVVSESNYTYNPVNKVICSQTSKTHIYVKWELPVYIIPDSFYIFRNGSFIGAVPGNERSFYDFNATAGTLIGYGVQCKAVNGQKSRIVYASGFRPNRVVVNGFLQNAYNGRGVSGAFVSLLHGISYSYPYWGARYYPYYAVDSTRTDSTGFYEFEVPESNDHYYSLWAHHPNSYIYLASNSFNTLSNQRLNMTDYRYIPEGPDTSICIPNGVTTSVNKSIYGVDIRWNVSNSNYSGFKIYREFTHIGTVLRGKPMIFTDTTAYPDVSNRYYVEAFVNTNNGFYASSRTMCLGRLPGVNPVINLLASADSRRNLVTLSWSHSEDEHSFYKIERSGATLGQVKAGTGFKYTDTSGIPGQMYTYTVTCYLLSGSRTYISSKQSVQIQYPYIAPVENLRITNAKYNAGLALRWTYPSTNYEAFLIYRDMQQVGKVNKGDSMLFQDYNTIPDSNHNYAVTVLLKAGGKMLESKPWKISQKAPQVQTIKSVNIIELSTALEDYVRLTWKPDTIAGISGYIVERANAVSPNAPLRVSLIQDVKKNLFIDSSFAPDSSYIYYVRAFADRGDPVVRYEGPRNSNNNKIRKAVLKPTALTASAGEGYDYIDLTWNYSGVTHHGFILYRNGAVLDTIRNKGSRTYTDLFSGSVIPDTMVNYTIRAFRRYNGVVYVSNVSDTASGYCLKTTEASTQFNQSLTFGTRIAISGNTLFASDYRAYSDEGSVTIFTFAGKWRKTGEIRNPNVSLASRGFGRDFVGLSDSIAAITMDHRYVALYHLVGKNWVLDTILQAPIYMNDPNSMAIGGAIRPNSMSRRFALKGNTFVYAKSDIGQYKSATNSFDSCFSEINVCSYSGGKWTYSQINKFVQPKIAYDAPMVELTDAADSVIFVPANANRITSNSPVIVPSTKAHIYYNNGGGNWSRMSDIQLVPADSIGFGYTPQGPGRSDALTYSKGRFLLKSVARNYANINDLKVYVTSQVLGGKIQHRNVWNKAVYQQPYPGTSSLDPEYYSIRMEQCDNYSIYTFGNSLTFTPVFGGTLDSIRSPFFSLYNGINRIVFDLAVTPKFIAASSSEGEVRIINHYRDQYSDRIASATSLTCSKGTIVDKVQLNWTVTTTKNILRFDIYRDKKLIDNVGSTMLNYYDNTGIPGKKYHYSVVVVDTGGLSSKPISDIGFAKPTGSIEGQVSNAITFSGIPGVNISAKGVIDGEEFYYYTVSDASGKYFFRDLPFGSGTTYIIIPSMPGHVFNYDTLSVYIDEQNPKGFAQTLLDQNSYLIKGNITRSGSDCGLDSVKVVLTQVYKNGNTVAKSSYSNNGAYSFLYDPNDRLILKYMLDFDSIRPNYTGGDTTFLRFPGGGHIDSVALISGGDTYVDIADTTLFPVNLRVVTACGTLKGNNQFIVRVKNKSGCISFIDTTLSNGTLHLNLPPDLYTFLINDVATPSAANIQMANFFAQKPVEVDLTLADMNDSTRTLYYGSPAEAEFIYHVPPSVSLYGFTRYYCSAIGGNSTGILKQGSKVSLSPRVIETHYGQGCQVSGGYIKFTNTAALEVNYKLKYDSALGAFPKYNFIAAEPNIVAPFVNSILAEYYTDDDQFLGSSTYYVIIEGSATVPGNDFYVDLDTLTNGMVQLPLYVLRDPPGDGSYSFIEKGVAFNNSLEISSSNEYAVSVKADFEGKIFGVGAKVEFGSKVGGGSGTTNAYEIGVETTQRFQTSDVSNKLTANGLGYLTGEKADVIVGAGLTTAYGVAMTLEVDTDNCNIQLKSKIATAVAGINTMWVYTVDQIQHLIDNYADDSARIAQGTLSFDGKTKEQALEIQTRRKRNWEQILYYHRNTTVPFYTLCDEANYKNLPEPFRTQARNWTQNGFCSEIGVYNTLPDGSKSFQLNQNIKWTQALLDKYKKVGEIARNLTDYQYQLRNPGGITWTKTALDNMQLDQAYNGLFGPDAENISFSGGTSYSKEVTVAKASGSTYAQESYLEAEIFGGTIIELSVETQIGTVVGLGAAVSATVETKIAESKLTVGMGFSYAHKYGAEQSTSYDTSITSGFELKDEDNGDQYSVTIFRGIAKNHTPYFVTLGGRSSCPYEPGTIYRDRMQLDFMGPNDSTPVTFPLRNLDPTKPLIIPVKMTNLNIFNESREFTLEIGPESNIYGANFKASGVTLGQYNYRIPPNSSVYTNLTITPNPPFYQYDSIEVGVFSECELDNVFGVSKYISFYFNSPCSKVSILSPYGKWAIKKADNEFMIFKIGDYDLNNANLEKVRFEYKRVGTNEWVEMGSVTRQELNAYYQNERYSGNPPTYPFVWNITGNRQLINGEYEVRATAVCKTGGLIFSNLVTGSIDRTSLFVFGKPEPADGVLSLGDAVSVKFNEVVNCAKFENATGAYAFFNESGQKIPVNAVCNNAQGLNFAFNDSLMKVYDGKKIRAVLYKNGITDIFDNTMADSLSWSFVVSYNPVYWATDTLYYRISAGATDSQELYLYNTGNIPRSYRLNDTSAWLEALPIWPGNIITAAGVPVRVRVNATNLAADNTYIDYITCSVNGFSDIVLPVKVIVYAKPVAWTLDKSRVFDKTANMIANYRFGNSGNKTSIDPRDQIGVFIDGKLRGYAGIKQIETYYGAFITIFGNAANDVNKPLSFRVYKASTSKEYAAYSQTPLVYRADTLFGSVTAPIILSVDSVADLVNYIPLNTGWNAFSLNRHAPDSSVSGVLNQLKYGKGLAVKTLTGMSQYASEGSWVSTTGLNNIVPDSGYLLYLGAPDTMVVSGTWATRQTLNLNQGWNLIGYSEREALPINSVLSTTDYRNQDYMKHAMGSKFSIFSAGSQQWQGTLDSLFPNQSYMIYVQDPNRTVYKNDPDPGILSVNASAFSSNMNITGKIMIDGAFATHDGDRVYAFAGSELRGVGTLKYVPALKNYYLTLFVYSNTNGEALTFKIYHELSNQWYDHLDTMLFENNRLMGSFSAPVIFRNMNATGIAQIQPAPERKVNIFPNPATDLVNLEFAGLTSDIATIQVIDLTGRVIYTQQVTQAQTAQTVQLDLNRMNLTKGVYVIQLTSDAFRKEQKLIKLK